MAESFGEPQIYSAHAELIEGDIFKNQGLRQAQSERYLINRRFLAISSAPLIKTKCQNFAHDPGRVLNKTTLQAKLRLCGHIFLSIADTKRPNSS